MVSNSLLVTQLINFAVKFVQQYPGNDVEVIKANLINRMNDTQAAKFLSNYNERNWLYRQEAEISGNRIKFKYLSLINDEQHAGSVRWYDKNGVNLVSNDWMIYDINDRGWTMEGGSDWYLTYAASIVTNHRDIPLLVQIANGGGSGTITTNNNGGGTIITNGGGNPVVNTSGGGKPVQQTTTPVMQTTPKQTQDYTVPIMLGIGVFGLWWYLK